MSVLTKFLWSAQTCETVTRELFTAIFNTKEKSVFFCQPYKCVLENVSLMFPPKNSNKINYFLDSSQHQQNIVYLFERAKRMTCWFDLSIIKVYFNLQSNFQNLNLNNLLHKFNLTLKEVGGFCNCQWADLIF